MMGYSNGYVASIILKGKPLREFKDNGKRTVKIPFGSEYVIRLKNKNREPSLVSVYIDGTDVLNGSQLVLESNSSLDLERFVENNDSGKKFKYISLEEGASSGEIDDPYRKENGLIQVKFYKAINLFQGSLSISKQDYDYNYQPFCGAVFNPYYGYTVNTTTTDGNTGSDAILSECSINSCSLDNNCFFSQADSEDLSKDKGATIEGSESNQVFSNTLGYVQQDNIDPVIMDIRLVGPEYKLNREEIVKEWGVFIGENKEPIAKFKDKKYAFSFAASDTFDNDKVVVKTV